MIADRERGTDEAGPDPAIDHDIRQMDWPVDLTAPAGTGPGQPEHVLRWIVRLDGDLDVFSSPRLLIQLRRLVDSGARVVVLDMHAVTFMDSAALGALVSVFKQLRAVDGRLLVCGLQPSPRQVLAITGLDRVLPLLVSVDEALTALDARTV